MNRKKIASLILATSIVTTQIATPVFAANTNDNTTNINSNEVVANDSTTRLVNNTTEFMEALKDSNIKNIKLNSDVTLKNDLTINRDLNVYGNRHSLDFANSRINSYKVINISFNDVSLKNGRSDNYGVICLNTANSKATFDNVNFNGPELLDAPNCTINLKGNCNFTTNSIQELFITGFINIEDGSNISINSKYNQGHWDGCSVLSTSWNNEKGGLTVGNNVNLTILTENNNACLGPSQLTNTNSFLKVGENSQVVFKNESSQKSNWRLAAYNVTKMDLADTATLDMSANNSWATVYSPAKFTWNLNNAHVKLSSNDTYYGLFGGSNGEINFGSSTNLQDVSIWSKDNTSEDANAIANDIYGTLNISGSSISSANISNPNLTSSLINSSTSGMSKLEFGIAKVDKSKLEELLNNKKDTTGMTPESAKKYEDALAAGQKVFDNPKATQQEVDDAVKAIENSSSALTPDKSGLQAAIDKAKDTLGSGKLIPDSEKALKDAINKAEGVLNNSNATVSDINNAIKDLEDATKGAITSADKSKLEELLNNKKDTAGMTSESAKKYNDALAAGQKVFNNPNATQQEVDDAVKAIENSSSALTPDKSGLQTAIDKAKDTLGSGKLIPDSEKVLKDAINKAEGVLNNPNATVSDINNAIKDLDNATSDVITSADKSKLEELLNNKVSIDGKTPESIKKYEDALAAGQKVFVNPNASQQEVDDAVKNIESALKNMNSSIASIASNFKEAYWQGNKLVFGGTFDILNTDVDQNSEKILIIKDNNGNIVKKINTWNASWNGNTGYQYFINVKDFESLSNGIYKLYVSTTINGATYESTVKQPKSLLRYIVHNNINDLESQRFGADIVKFSSNSDNDIIFTKELSVLTPSVNVKTMYFNESGLVVDGNFGFQGTSLDNPIKVKLLIKDYTGNTIETIDTWNASWGEKNTGFQGIISNEVLSKITKGEYTLVAKADFNGENYETKLVTDSSFKFNSVINDSFKIEVNATSDSVTFEKVTALKFDSSSEIKQSYWDGDNFVINGVVNIGDKVLDKNDIKKVVIKDSDGNQVGEVSTVSVDWFSKKGNFSGFQAIIPETLMEKLDIGTYSLEVQTTYNDIEYSNEIKQIPSLLRVFSIYKNVNDTEGKLFNGLLYKFATGSNSNVVLNIKENILPAQSIANNVYWQSNLNTYFINGGVTIDGKEMHPSESEPHMLVLKNSNGEVVSKSSEVVPGWNEENPYQAPINGAMINNLEPGTYTVYIKVTYDGKVYEAPIKLNKDLVLNTEKHQTDRYIVNVGLNSSKDLTITIK
ncbi:TPA: hypothetical protein I9148_003037 [Clostridium perfringens]|nr:hypothetical protein [Clostridium perfringens]